MKKLLLLCLCCLPACLESGESDPTLAQHVADSVVVVEAPVVNGPPNTPPDAWTTTRVDGVFRTFRCWIVTPGVSTP